LVEYGKALFKAKKYADAAAKYNAKKQACGSLTSLDVFYLGRSYMLAGDSLKADSAFAEFSQRNPTSPDGYWWRARVNLTLGKTEDYLAMPYYLKYTEIAGTEPAKYKKNLTEAFVYLGIYNFEKVKNKEEAKAYFTKALELDPADELATLYMKQF
jgi:tetratricopeptide (TPR) repeat protein